MMTDIPADPSHLRTWSFLPPSHGPVSHSLRHKERFVSKFVSLSNNKPRLPDSAPSTSAPAAQEVHALLNSDPPPHKQPLPQEVEVEEEEEEEEEEVVESKAFDFNNTSYFLVQTDQS